MKTKLYYHEDGKLYYSRIWPDVPPVMTSIYADEVAYQRFKKEMDYLTGEYVGVVVTNHDHAMTCVVFHSDKPIERGQFYEIPNDVKVSSVDGRYTVEIN